MALKNDFRWRQERSQGIIPFYFPGEGRGKITRMRRILRVKKISIVKLVDMLKTRVSPIQINLRTN